MDILKTVLDVGGVRCVLVSHVSPAFCSLLVDVPHKSWEKRGSFLTAHVVSMILF